MEISKRDHRVIGNTRFYQDQIIMHRRSTVVSGCVNFPVNDPSWRNTKEGGMVVKLVVFDNREFDNQFAVCSGGYVFDLLTESFTADDKRPFPELPSTYASIDDINTEQKLIAAWQEYHFPHLNDDTADVTGRYLSHGYLAAMVLGTTGWSGSHIVTGALWECHFDDLTDDGKTLYRQIEKLYTGCDLHLLTFLDT